MEAATAQALSDAAFWVLVIFGSGLVLVALLIVAVLYERKSRTPSEQ